MKKLPFLPLLLVFFVPIIVGFSTISTPFALIDDSKIINFSKELQKGDFSILLKDERPAYRLAYHIPYVLKNQNSSAYHLFHLLLFSAISILIFLIIFSLTENSLAGIIASFGYLFSTSTLDTWTRLGISEPLLVFFLLFAIFNLVKIYNFSEKDFFSKKNFFLSLFLCLASLILATFTKETALAIIPPLLILTALSIFSIRKISLFIQSLLTIILFQTIFGLIMIFFRNPQNLPYLPNQEFILKNYHLLSKLIQKDIGYLLPISFISLILMLIKKSKDLRHRTSIFKAFCLFFLVLSGSFLLAETMHQNASNLYLSPFFMSIYLFMGCSLSYLFSIFKRLKKSPVGHTKVIGHLLSLIFLFYCLIFFYFQIKEALITINDNKDKASLHSEMVKALSKNLFEKSKIYFVIKDANFDYGQETGLHLKFFYNKENPIERLNPNLLPPLQTGDLIVVSQQYPPVTESVLNQILPRKTLLYHTYLWTIYRIER